MFVVSYNWILEILNKNFEFEEILKALDTLGFEVKETESVKNYFVSGEDYLITIEVKANRPDMLSHFGVARELASFFDINLEEPVFDFYQDFNNIQEKKLEVKINTNLCENYNAFYIENINNTVQTPDYIKNRLKLFGIESINPVVDISNYVTLEYGQPTHVYDRDKFSENSLEICENNNTCDFKDLSNKNLKLQNGDIIIKNNNKIVCLAGIIGSEITETDKNTKNIIIESAVFNKIPIRVAAKRLKISTLASFRFERGVDSENSLNILNLIAKKIIDLCGGRLVYKFIYKLNKNIDKKLNLRANRVNNILGTSLKINQISESLEKYKFVCDKKDDNNILVKIPSFRLDIEREIDLIEEVARSIGYDMIEPKSPKINLIYRPNKLYEKFDILRNILIGFGFNEVINYSFIPSEICNIINNLDKNNCIILQNPISNLYDLMRPNLIYSLLYSLSYNYSIGNYNNSFFEIGKIYELDKNSETFAQETDCLGFTISGNKIESGFGINKPIKYDFYDLNSYLNVIFDYFNQKNIKFIQKNISYMNNYYDLIFENKNLGFIGEINKSKFVKILPNLKLIKDKIFYCEIKINKLKDSKKVLKFESKFPAIIRQYNFICPKNIFSNEIINYIKIKNKLINKISIKDIYEDNNMSINEHSLLFEIEYRSPERTINSDEIELIENNLLNNLSEKFSIKIKK